MPELPEVETVKNILEPAIKNKTIDYIDVFYDRLIQSDLITFKNELKNRTILYLSRYGKYLFIHLDNDLVIITHLRMEGKFRTAKDYSSARIKHTSMIFYFKDGTALAFDDTRKFGLMYLSNENEYKEIPMIKKLGVEANKVQESDLALLYKKFDRKKPIKELLLDQTILCGIGNIYADEICYLSKISPFTLGRELCHQNIDDIVKNSKIVLEKAINLGGSTIHSFHPSEGVDGRFQEELMCYRKQGQICPNCGTRFHKDFLGGRGTTYCPNCQIDHSLEKAIGLTGPIGSGKSTLLKHFKENGFICYSCDELVRELYKEEIHKRNISKILGCPFDIENEILTKNARHIMISNPEKKVAVENYIYPVLEKVLVKIVKENDLVIIEAPTLFKAHIEYLFKKILVIEIDNTQQVKNLISRHDDVSSSKKLNHDFLYQKNNPKIRIVKATGEFDSFFKNADEALKD